MSKANSVTDVDVFKNILELLGNVHRTTTDQLARNMIEDGLNRIVGCTHDVPSILHGRYCKECGTRPSVCSEGIYDRCDLEG